MLLLFIATVNVYLSIYLSIYLFVSIALCIHSCCYADARQKNPFNAATDSRLPFHHRLLFFAPSVKTNIFDGDE